MCHLCNAIQSSVQSTISIFLSISLQVQNAFTPGLWCFSEDRTVHGEVGQKISEASCQTSVPGVCLGLPTAITQGYCHTLLLLAHQEFSQQYTWLSSLSQLCRSLLLITEGTAGARCCSFQPQLPALSSGQSCHWCCRTG